MKPEDNPFFCGYVSWSDDRCRSGRTPTFYTDAVSRTARAKTFSFAECARALKLPGLQKAVRVAIERRERILKRLTR